MLTPIELDLKYFLLIILFVFNSSNSFACSCNQPIDFSLKEFCNNDEIFLGKCLGFEKDTVFNQLTNYFFEVLELYKGQNKKQIKLQSANYGGMCGMKFIPGNRYLLFAKNGKTSSCSSNFALDSDSLNLWNSKIEFYVKLKDTMATFNGVEMMNMFHKANRMKMEVLRKIANTKNGIVNSYFINEELNSFVTIQNGKLNGAVEFYYQNRKLEFKGNIINGKKDGYCEEYRFSLKKDNTGYVYIKEWGEYQNDIRVEIWRYKAIDGKFQETIESIGNPDQSDEGEIKY